MTTVIYAYWLGLFMIGPFDTFSACQDAYRWQMAQGSREEVSECGAIIDTRGTTYSIASPTYGAPLTPAEYARRQSIHSGTE